MTVEEAINYVVQERDTYIEVCEEWEALDMAIKALEKQIPKKPIDLANSTYSKCPTCGNFHFDNYCANCGQKIDWIKNENV